MDRSTFILLLSCQKLHSLKHACSELWLRTNFPSLLSEVAPIFMNQIWVKHSRFCNFRYLENEIAMILYIQSNLKNDFAFISSQSTVCLWNQFTYNVLGFRFVRQRSASLQNDPPSDSDFFQSWVGRNLSFTAPFSISRERRITQVPLY